MKKLIIAASLIVVAATAFDDNIPVIRSFKGVAGDVEYVRRFDDGLNTCYIVNFTLPQGIHDGSSISCVARSK